MKKTFKFLIFSISIILLSSCEKEYLDTKPTDSYTDKVVLSNTTNAISAINGMHRMMYGQSGSSGYSAGSQDKCGQQSVNIVSDLLADDVLLPNSTNSWYRGVYQWLDHRNETAAWPRYLYSYYYKMIGNANQLISNLDQMTGPDNEKAMIKGEALAFRGWSHFMLVQFFAKRYNAASKPNSQAGIPIMITGSTDGLPRASVEEVYAQIVKDLDDAITAFGTAKARPNKSHLNANVAKGIRARVALAMQDWANAAKFAAEARTGFSLMSNALYTAGFNDLTNPEWMWGSQVIADQTNYFYGFFAFMSANGNSTNIRQTPKVINADLYNLIPATDIRKKCWDPAGTSIPAPAGGVKAKYGHLKFLTTTPTATSFLGDPVYMRVAEMYLIEAEANARLNKDAEAQTALYTLAVNRNPSYIKSTNTGPALVSEILVQRRWELWGEGFRFLDLKRMGASLDRACANFQQSVAMVQTTAAGDKTWEWLIPKNEFEANKNLGEQNPL